MQARSFFGAAPRHARSGSSGAVLQQQREHVHSSSHGRLPTEAALGVQLDERSATAKPPAASAAAANGQAADMKYVNHIFATVEALKKKREEEANDPQAQERKAEADRALRARYEELLLFKENQSLKDQMMSIRRLVISDGLPEETEEEREKRSASNAAQSTFCTLRGTIWKLLLGALHVDAQRYIDLLNMGPCWADRKLRNDTFRTFKGDEEFQSRVNESQLARVLTSYIRLNFPEPPPDDYDTGLGYVQGMNVLLAPFLYVMPELDAFYCYNALLTRQCPRYVLKNMEGAHDGCALVDRILLITDPQLHSYLERKSVFATIYAFPMIVTLMGCLKPLSQVLKVWDAVFSFGIHFSVLLCVAQVILIRDVLLKDPNPMKYLGPRGLAEHHTDAELLVTVALKISRFVPREMQTALVKHPAERTPIPGTALAGNPVTPSTRLPSNTTQQRASSAERGQNRRRGSENLTNAAKAAGAQNRANAVRTRSPKRSPVREAKTGEVRAPATKRLANTTGSRTLRR